MEGAHATIRQGGKMINEAGEESPGGSHAVHHLLRRTVPDLTTFMGSTASSVDNIADKSLTEIR